ncbi:MAG: DNA-binding protein [Hydrogenophilales bacterium 17-61-9]|nr:MAG: DNA-binding protein [Hydrogenophilales bacterium 16-62-9]OZA23348.1 MAG: DNA-binding protein [Hydrogenophilales bacterium 17-61-9]
MRHQGKITDWKEDRGFGFITPNGGGPRVFVHIKSFSGRQQRPLGNEIVTYELRLDARGRPQAGSVAFVGKDRPPANPSGQGNVTPMLALAFLVFVGGSAFAGKLPIAVAWFYLAASLIAFAAYALDKSAARNDRWRTQERTLHLFALAGGWPGALAAQRLLRHKSRKQSFQIVFWATVMLNCFALAWFFSDTGAEALRSMLGAA